VKEEKTTKEAEAFAKTVPSTLKNWVYKLGAFLWKSVGALLVFAGSLLWNAGTAMLSTKTITDHE
jgi:hypothetical protein